LVPQRALGFLGEVRRQVRGLYVVDAENAPTTLISDPLSELHPRLQSRDERERMLHLGPRYLNSESREFRFRFSAFGRHSPPPSMGFTTGSTSSTYAKSRWQHSESTPYRPKAASLKRPSAHNEPESPLYQPNAAPAARARRPVPSRWIQAPPPTDRSRLAPARPPFAGPIGRMPLVPPSTLLVEGDLTGKVCSAVLSLVFISPTHKRTEGRAPCGALSLLQKTPHYRGIQQKTL
jgi:hypothetical protein